MTSPLRPSREMMGEDLGDGIRSAGALEREATS